MADAVSPTSSKSAATTTPATTDVFNGMGPDMFLKLLVAQIQYQNPMNPSDPTAMLGQVASYAQVESLTKLQTLQASGNSLSETQIATSLIGQQVSATDAAGKAVSGKVTAARFTDAGAVLVLDTGAELSVSALSNVGNTVTATTTPTTTTPTTGTTPTTTTPTTTTPTTTTPTTTTTPATGTDTSSTPTSTSTDAATAQVPATAAA